MPSAQTMPPRLLCLAAFAALLTPARAILPPIILPPVIIFPPVPDKVQLFETQSTPNRVDYTLTNPLSPQTPFDVTLFAVSIPQEPVTPQDPVMPVAPAGWNAQVLSLADWSQPIGGVSSRPSWERFTGQTFSAIFAAANTALGYYIPFTPAADGTWSYSPQDPVKPGRALSGFSRTGLAASAFIAAGPVDSATFIGDADDNPTQGVTNLIGTTTTTAVPEPTTALCGLGLLAGLACSRPRQRRKGLSMT